MLIIPLVKLSTPSCLILGQRPWSWCQFDVWHWQAATENGTERSCSRVLDPDAWRGEGWIKDIEDCCNVDSSRNPTIRERFFSTRLYSAVFPCFTGDNYVNLLKLINRTTAPPDPWNTHHPARTAGRQAESQGTQTTGCKGIPSKRLQHFAATCWAPRGKQRIDHPPLFSSDLPRARSKGHQDIETLGHQDT